VAPTRPISRAVPFARSATRTHGDVFAKVDHRPELAHGTLPRQHFGQRRRRAQPLRERRLARLGARRIQQLEERASTEEIEVARVRMVVREGVAAPPGAGPPVVEAIEAAQIDTLRTARPIESLQPLRVHDGEDAERQPDGDSRGHAFDARERHPQRHGAETGEHEPAVRDPEVDAIERDDALAPRGQAAFVFGAGSSHVAVRGVRL
jgi:hypothetical protein